jgi:aminoglycoside phosphotransferase (APT) family kinase protein
MTRHFPTTLDAALDPAWLSEALAARVDRVEVVQKVQVNQKIKATVVRFNAHYVDGGSDALCLKGRLDVAEGENRNSQSAHEARFYTEIAPKISVQRPVCVAAPTNADGTLAILLMQDLITRGARFCTALEPFDAARTKKSLEQLARLHTSPKAIGPNEEIGWLTRRLDWFVSYLPVDMVQGLLNDPRSEGLPARTIDASLMFKALAALASEDAKRAPVLIHGDCHAGNAFETSEGMGIIDWELLQKGGWSLDVAYHINAVLPVDVAEREERSLLRHYLETARSLGASVPDDEEAWSQYRKSVVYGFMLWAITRTVAPEIIKTFIQRLGGAVTRHETYKLLEF